MSGLLSVDSLSQHLEVVDGARKGPVGQSTGPEFKINPGTLTGNRGCGGRVRPYFLREVSPPVHIMHSRHKSIHTKGLGCAMMLGI